MKVLLVDDNRLMLEGLQNLLDAHNIEVAGVAFDGLESVEMAREVDPDVILMDIRMPRCDGLTATRLIKAENPDAKIVMLTTSTEDDDLFEAIKSGACGYLLKSIDTDELVEALNQVQQGTPPFSPGLAAKLLEEFKRSGNSKEPISPKSSEKKTEAPPKGKLNARQIEVLRLSQMGSRIKKSGHDYF
jgi:two-component system NarL family response regulator